jgi:hypothetical protein
MLMLRKVTKKETLQLQYNTITKSNIVRPLTEIASNVNHFGQPVSELPTVVLRGQSRTAANIGFCASVA